MCQRLDEDGAHLFLKCKAVKAVWRELNLETVRSDLLDAHSARDMMEKIMKLEPKRQLMTILLLWLWWNERNGFREEGKRRTTVEVAYVTAALADRFQTKRTEPPLSVSCQTSKWSRPEPGVLKVNSDGAFDRKTNSGGWGFIIRDEHGDMIHAGAGAEPFLQNALHAELIGCVEGATTAARLGISQLILETDATQVKAAAEGEEYRLSAFGWPSF
jgi:hypothetical protein